MPDETPERHFDRSKKPRRNRQTAQAGVPQVTQELEATRKGLPDARGSAFAIEVTLAPIGTAVQHEHDPSGLDDRVAGNARYKGVILVVEDDPEVRELLDLLLKDDGYRITTAPDGPAALELIVRGIIQPDLILADYSLSNDMNGIQVAMKLREKLHRKIPTIILTGDISTATSRAIALHDCVRLNKPVGLKELTQVIQCHLPVSQSAKHPYAPHPVNPELPPRSVSDS